VRWLLRGIRPVAGSPKRPTLKVGRSKTAKRQPDLVGSGFFRAPKGHSRERSDGTLTVAVANQPRLCWPGLPMPCRLNGRASAHGRAGFATRPSPSLLFKPPLPPHRRMRMPRSSLVGAGCQQGSPEPTPRPPGQTCASTPQSARGALTPHTHPATPRQGGTSPSDRHSWRAARHGRTPWHCRADLTRYPHPCYGRQPAARPRTPHAAGTDQGPPRHGLPPA
jgi:hypothetical protein